MHTPFIFGIAIAATFALMEGRAWGKTVRPSSPVCEALNQYPRNVFKNLTSAKSHAGKLAFEAGEISPMCTPFIKQKTRPELDRCGDSRRDPYASRSTVSHFTWASRSEMSRRGKQNLFIDNVYRERLPEIYKRIETLRGRATTVCCGSDLSCQKAMAAVEVKFCEPNADPNLPDSCVFGGNFKMPGSAYNTVFRLINARNSHEPLNSEFRQIAARNLGSREPALATGEILSSGSIVLSSYVPKDQGFSALEPTLMHEFGHACSMVKMQNAATADTSPKALRAARWLDRARKRCDADVALPDAYYDFWESLGESRELAQCLYKLTDDNQKALVDQPCNGLCPGHFLEESVGVAFSFLTGELDGSVGSVFPQTCDHVRDGQHPMVSDVLECLTEHSPRFRARMRATYRCDEGSSSSTTTSIKAGVGSSGS